MSSTTQLIDSISVDINTIDKNTAIDIEIQEIDKNRQEIEGLNHNSDKLERFAREKYLMKRENEDIFVIVEWLFLC